MVQTRGQAPKLKSVSISLFNFSTEVKSAFRNVSIKKIKIYCMAIGADSDLFSLKSVSTYPIVFSSVDIINAISKVCGHLND